MLECAAQSDANECRVFSPSFGNSHPCFQDIVTADVGMREVFRISERVAETNNTVLILGESGTGKELIARAVHKISGRRGAFVPVNCGAIPDNLLESELFGHEKGAFTGAISSRPGRFVLADKGTIFLDEIGEMSPHLQVKLLRVLQDKCVEPVGGVKSRVVDVRIVAATHVDLKKKVEAGEFREDLFYRLQVIPLEIPPLRDRKGDVDLLANHFAMVSAEFNNRRILEFSPEVLEVFEKYPWPGNVRELENLVERLTILIDRDTVCLEDLPEQFLRIGEKCDSRVPQTVLPAEGLDFNSVVAEFEDSLILQALKRTGGNKKAASELLNLNRTTLVEKIKKKGLALSLDEGSGEHAKVAA